MKSNPVKIAFAMGVLLLYSLCPDALRAQTPATTPSGEITSCWGRTVPNAQIPFKSADSGESIEGEMDLAARYNVLSLAPGDHAIAKSAERFATQSAPLTFIGTEQTMVLPRNASLAAGPWSAGFVQEENPANKPAGAPPANPPNSPPNNTAPTLEDLGLTPNQTQGSAQQQALLEKRTHMLKVHQTLGLITAIPMAAALITGPQAKSKGKNGQTITEPTQANLDFHIALGGLTTGLYWTTAYYSIFAPKVAGVKPKGAIRLHRDLEWVHGPGMILTPILGIMAYKQENAGERVHGIASAHGAAAYVTAAAYGASIVAISWPIHLKFWE